ncbi:MAG: aminomethyltransferase beta-barrel domain-containing protein, partial [Hominimerdicola sp.]
KNNKLVLGNAGQITKESLIAEDVNFIPFDKLEQPIRCTAQTRYHQKDVPCTISPMEDGKVLVSFDNPHKAISKGQAVVFYDGDYVIGGGTII